MYLSRPARQTDVVPLTLSADGRAQATASRLAIHKRKQVGGTQTLGPTSSSSSRQARRHQSFQRASTHLTQPNLLFVHPYPTPSKPTASTTTTADDVPQIRSTCPKSIVLPRRRFFTRYTTTLRRCGACQATRLFPTVAGDATDLPVSLTTQPLVILTINQSRLSRTTIR